MAGNELLTDNAFVVRLGSAKNSSRLATNCNVWCLAKARVIEVVLAASFLWRANEEESVIVVFCSHYFSSSPGHSGGKWRLRLRFILSFALFYISSSSSSSAFFCERCEVRRRKRKRGEKSRRRQNREKGTCEHFNLVNSSPSSVLGAWA